MDWIPEIERQSQADIIALQERKLREVLAYVNEHSQFYKQLFEQHHIRIEDIKTLPVSSLLLAKTTCSAITMLLGVYLNRL